MIIVKLFVINDDFPYMTQVYYCPSPSDILSNLQIRLYLMIIVWS